MRLDVINLLTTYALLPIPVSAFGIPVKRICHDIFSKDKRFKLLLLRLAVGRAERLITPRGVYLSF